MESIAHRRIPCEVCTWHNCDVPCLLKVTKTTEKELKDV